jgi:hypothetical protein
MLKGTPPMTGAVPSDEFGLLADNAAETGLPFPGPSAVRRQTFAAAGQEVSAIIWGRAEPELVLLHGGGQNAHTWDTVALALGRPLIALDLPGHGHFGRRVRHNAAEGGIYGTGCSLDELFLTRNASTFEQMACKEGVQAHSCEHRTRHPHHGTLREDR